jgi:two-component system, LuxR family, sensor kinase FixL
MPPRSQPPDLPAHELLDAAPDAIVIADAQGRIVLVNLQTERLFGYDRGELIGEPVEVLIPRRYRGAHPRYREGYFAEPRVRPMGAGQLALFGLRKNGQEFPAEISLSPLHTDSGVLAITAIRDITERKRIEEEQARRVKAEEALRLRDEFLSIAAHELRTPLTTLHMQAQAGKLLLARGGDDIQGHIAARIDAIDRAARRMTGLIDQLLDLSRITSGRLRLEREEADAVVVVRGAIEALEEELERAGSELVFDAPESLHGEWDAMRLEQVVTNLVSNAVKYGEGKPIEVSLMERNGTAVIEVRDHGIGIAPEDQLRMFQRFERLVSHHHYGGFGLGLWIAREIVEAHGGSIRVWSEVGAGATFTVELPRAAPETASEAARGGKRAPLMVIDDDPSIRESFVDLLGEQGHEVVGAADGEEALEKLRHGLRPRVIFLDLMMPGMDGRAFRSEQQRDPDLAAIPVYVVSAAANASEISATLGVEGVLKKPVDVEELFRIAASYA